MFTSKFAQIRDSFHTFSRSPLAKGQKWLDQAGGVAGHTVSFDKVRAEQIPAIATLQDRDNLFLEIKDGKKIVGGVYGKQYASIIRFYNDATLREIPNTNGESYVVVDSAGAVLSNFISPTDKPLNYQTLSEGYEFRLIAEDGTEISQNYKWTFDYFSGIVHFEGQVKPGSALWTFGTVRAECFTYIGKFISSIINDISSSQGSIDDEIKKAVDSMIAIQPFKFTSEQMTIIGDPYRVDYPLEQEGKHVINYFQVLSFIVPGYVFDLISLDTEETILTEMRHLLNGDTQIFINIPWDLKYECPIMSYIYDSGIDGVGNRIPVIGKYKFLAMTFVTNSGEKIKTLPMIDYEANPDDVIPVVAEGYEGMGEFEPGRAVSSLDLPEEPHATCGCGHCDDANLINVINTRVKG